MSQEEGTDTTNKAENSDAHGRRCKWTIMIYLAGDNNLSANSLSVLQQLEAANIPRGDDVRVLACFDANTPRPRGARYLEIKRRRFTHPNPHLNWGLHDDLVTFEDLQTLEFHPVEAPDFCNSQNTSRPTPLPVVKEGLSRFLEFALGQHPADRYMLILYGHGTAVAGNTFLADNNPPSFLRLLDFADVLAKHFDVRDDAEQYDDWLKAVTEEPGSQDKPPYKCKPALDILACDNCIMNGIETAYQVRQQVEYILGSQGLSLALGWPFRKIINTVVRLRDKPTARVAKGLLRVCARNLIDFMLMDRSSEQSLCDLTTLRRQRNLVWAVRGLSKAMRDGLRVTTDEDIEKEAYMYKKVGEVLYPAIRDAIRQARLEAQSYWGERFVDLYDFCALLLERCNDYLYQFYIFSVELQLNERNAPKAANLSMLDLRETLDMLSVVQKFDRIAKWCRAVLREVKAKRFVLKSYYIGPSLQYSNGVSIYFPWTLPEQPIIFEPVDKDGNCASAGCYNISWAELSKLQHIPREYSVKTAFEEYQSYAFAREDGGDWANFLVSFFKATLRNVRRFDYRYVKPEKMDKNRDDSDFFFFFPERRGELLIVPPEDIDLQKSDSDKGSEEDCACPEIKNYPRRFYISPADCEQKCQLPLEVRRRRERVGDAKDEADKDAADEGKEPCVSYLGWNIRGLVAEVIQFKGGKSGTLDARDFDEAGEPEESEDDAPDSDEAELDEPDEEGESDDDNDEPEE